MHKNYPTKAQRKALFEFRNMHGAQWKSMLRRIWANGQDENQPLLRQLRNHFGTQWLNKIDLDTLWVDQVKEVAKHYVIAAIWAEAEEGTSPRPTEATLQEAFRQCERFIDEAGPLFELAIERYSPLGDGSTPEARFGHDYWLTRSGHGCGYWDRDELDQDQVGEKLTELCQHKEPSFDFANGWFHLYRDL